MLLSIISKLENTKSKVTIDLKNPTFDRKELKGKIVDHDDISLKIQLSEGPEDRKKELIIFFHNIKGIAEHEKYTTFFEKAKKDDQS